jgi:hypothetical protein
MSKVKKDEIMPSQIPTTELPTPEQKRLMQAEVNQELFDEAHKEMKRRNLKIRQVVEFGLKAFISASKEQNKSGLAKKK